MTSRRDRFTVSLTAASALLALVVLGGCATPEPPVTPPPVSTVEPVFASDEEALAAAREAYEEYLAVSDAIAQDGGKDPERIKPHVTEGHYISELGAFESLTGSGRHTVGDTRIVDIALQQHDLASVVTYVCIDVSGVKVVAADGSDATPDRAATFALEVRFAVGDAEDRKLLLSGSEPWASATTC